MSKSKFAFTFFLIFWLGLLVGVSFFCTPIKFLLPDLTRNLSLQLGDLTFRYFNYIEWFVFVLLVLSSIWALYEFKRPKFVFWMVVLLGLILVMDSFYLLPNLHNYVVLLVNPETSVEGLDISLYHHFYVWGDFLKVFLQLSLLFFISKH